MLNYLPGQGAEVVGLLPVALLGTSLPSYAHDHRECCQSLHMTAAAAAHRHVGGVR